MNWLVAANVLSLNFKVRGAAGWIASLNPSQMLRFYSLSTLNLLGVPSGVGFLWLRGSRWHKLSMKKQKQIVLRPNGPMTLSLPLERCAVSFANVMAPE